MKNARPANKEKGFATPFTTQAPINRHYEQANRHEKPLDFKKERDQWVDNLTENVWQVCRNHLLQFTPKNELLICLVAIEDSIKTHTARDPRGYLEFLDDFFKKLGATTQQVDEQTASQFMIAEKT